MRIITPQKGFQWDFLSSPADITIGGGAAGAGKTFVLLMEPCRNMGVKGFGGVIFRRTYPQITNEGGLWDTSKDIYMGMGARPNESNLTWKFPKGTKLKFSQLQYENNVYDFQGAQIPYIGFDELTHFTEKQFFYMLSRNRSTCGVKPYVRATCNPDPESWVARFIEWWIDPVTGLPIPERGGILRYFIKDGDKVIWGNTKQEVIKRCPHVFDNPEFKGLNMEDLVKSATFIPGTVYQNQELMKKDPAYVGNLLSQDPETKARLLDGNWKIKDSEDYLIKYEHILNTFTNTFVLGGQRYISADLAFHGSDLFIVCVWDGWRLIDIETISKSDGKIIEDVIKAMANKHKVPRSNIVYDADGVGTYLRGYLQGARPFNNGSAPILEKNAKVNYKNLKTQCYYHVSSLINSSKIYVTDVVANKKINGKFVRELIIEESRAIKKKMTDPDNKLQIISKDEMKNLLGRSPDFMDAIMMRSCFDLKKATPGMAKFHFG